MATSVRISRSTLSSSDTANGSRTNRRPVLADQRRRGGAAAPAMRLTRDDALAIRTAWRAASSTLAALRSSTPANPQAPPAITRMPMPSSSNSSTDATTPFLTVSRCTVRLMTLQSAYDAPAADAASSARSLR